MNLERHVRRIASCYEHLADGRDDKAEAIQAFYDEYFAVLDLPAEFYLETVAAVFQEHALARGELECRGRRVDPARSGAPRC